MNLLLRAFGIKDEEVLTKPCPHCGRPMPRSPRETAVDLYLDDRIDAAELERRLDSAEALG